MRAKIHKNVHIGKGSIVEDNCEIGRPPRGMKDGELETVIGEGATIRSGTIIYAGTKIGSGFQSGHNVLIREGNVIGNGVSIGTGSAVEIDNKIGDNTRIHSLCFLEKVDIGKSVFIGPNVVFLDDPHPNLPKGLDCMRGAIVKDHAKIGGGSRILPWITIGENAFVGAGSVVTRDVEKNIVVVGTPAKRLKRLTDITCDKNESGPHKPYDSTR